MKIAIDGYEANVKDRLGSSQVAFELLRSFEKIDKHSLRSDDLKKNEYTILLPEKPLDDLPKERNGWSYKILRPKRLWTRIALPLFLYLNKKKIDLFFSPTHYIPRFSPIKRIATIFDLSFLHLPQMFKGEDLWKLTNWTKFSAENAQHIITISNSSKNDIEKQYGIGKDKITVAYPGFDRNIFYPKDNIIKIRKILKKYGIFTAYIIYIGTIQPRKNLVRLIESVSRIDGLKLVVVGKAKGEGREGWMFKDSLNAPKTFGIEDRVKFLGYVPTEDLPYLLSGAIAFIQPSLWEGFGIPVVEAMACGVPVLVSNVSSLIEVVGSAGLTFDPYSIDQMEQALRVVVSDKKLRQKLSKATLNQAQKFSWSKMAKTVLRVFEEVDSN